ncbi:MAG: HEAT repeat domain-containing protein [Acidobacteriota bacterium]|nr:MAG: HEAT repeat domain-containing protein [Acidobacteriota bacterium]
MRNDGGGAEGGGRQTPRLTGIVLLLVCAGLLAACGGGLGGGTPDEKALAAAQLGKRGANENIATLVEAIETQPELVQINAVDALGRIGTKRAVDALARFIEHESLLVRVAVAQALRDVEPEFYPDAAEVLVRMGEQALPRGPGDDPALEVRRTVTTSLAVVKQPAGIDFLLQRLANDYDENIRNASVMTLGRLGDPRAVDSLIEVYHTDNNRNRSWAVEALGEIGDPKGLATVLEALQDFDAVTRGKAAWAVMQLQGDRAREVIEQALAIEEDDLAAVVMAHCLALMGDKAAVAFLEDRTLRARSELARAEAARILGDVGRRESMEVLDKAFYEDRDGLVKREAGISMRKLIERFPSESAS